MSKYGKPHEILTAYEAARKAARGDSFLARQLLAVVSRAAGLSFDKVQRIWQQEVRGTADSAAVAVNFLRFAEGGFPVKSHASYFYLFPKKSKQPYPIAKFLLLCAIAAGERGSSKSKARPEVALFVQDPWMRAALEAINAAWFK